MSQHIPEFRSVRGQALSEAIIIMPIVLIVSLGLIQALWLLLAAVMFQHAALNAAYSGALTGLNRVEMQAEFQRKIAALPGAGLSETHLPYPVSFTVISPGQEEFRALATAADGEYQLVLSHFNVALSRLSEEERVAMLELRELVIQANWCFELRVPLIGFIIEEAMTRLSSRQPCLSLSGLPMMELTQTFVVPLRSDLTLDSERVVKFVTGR